MTNSEKISFISCLRIKIAKFDMDTYQAILRTLNQSTTSNKAQLKVLTCLIIGVIRSRSVNLSKLDSLQQSNASEESQYRKLQRFFLLWIFP